MQVPDAGAGHQLPVEQSLHIRRIGANRPAIEVTGNRGGILMVEEPAGVSIFARTARRPGTMTTPVLAGIADQFHVPVDTSISLRHRCGFWNANCWASAPPHDGDEWVEHFPAGADAVAQHQRDPAPAPDRHPNLLPKYRDEPLFGGRPSEAAVTSRARNCPVRLNARHARPTG